MATTVLVIYKGPATGVAGFTPTPIFNEVGILFLIGLIGWMPTAVEASSWISLWSLEKYKTLDQRPTLKEALQEFNSGYLLTALLAIFFLVVGWMTLYGTNTDLSGDATVFADQVVQLFTIHIGDWAYLLIAISAFATMFSTCMTAHDAIARVSLDLIGYLSPQEKKYDKRNHFAIGVIVLALVNFIVLYAFGANMGNLVALATFISFVMAPIVGYMNLKNVMSDDLPEAHRPKLGLRILTYTGIVFLAVFAVYYFWMVIS